MKALFRSLAFCTVALLLFARSADAVVLGQLDNFQTGTTMNWTTGPFAPQVAHVANGGPAGAGDGYIQLTATGAGAGGRLTGLNYSQWLGDYIAAGVTAIQIDLLNLSAVDLSIRLAFKSASGNGMPGYVSLPMVLPAGSGWQTFTVSLAPENMTALGNPSAYNTFFSSGIGEARIINSVSADLNGDFVTGQLGIDNIRAVPEPTTTALFAGSVLALGAYLRRRQRRAAGR